MFIEQKNKHNFNKMHMFHHVIFALRRFTSHHIAVNYGSNSNKKKYIQFEILKEDFKRIFNKKKWQVRRTSPSIICLCLGDFYLGF